MDEQQQETMRQEGRRTPQPDPTDRTREELLREIEHLRELVEAELKGHSSFARTRHDDLALLVKERIDATERHFDLHLTEARHQLQDAIDATKLAIEAALEAATKAVDKAEIATEKRFEGVNEFRQQLADQNATFLRIDMFNQHEREAREATQMLQKLVQSNTDQLLTLTASESGGQDREAQARANLATMFAGIATIVAVATLIFSLVG